ncbi:hypothetical protein [Halosegnis sp.]|uniref:hypothetical protein n=1 Tax=Halosegnis sp. TaxID=2864959 RepID=UPI0035D3D8DC
MAPTVNELRDEIRTAVGRYERVESTAFTKEALAAVLESVGGSVGAGRLPPKAEMRTEIRRRVDGLDAETEGDRPLRKAELTTLAAALGGEDGYDGSAS